jgi:hypothetical protein
LHPDLSTNLTMDTPSQTSPHKAPTTPFVYRAESLQLKSPSHVANTSARRCVGPILSQSPARLGHSACIRQVFDSKHQQHLDVRQIQDIMYPHLADVSRQISPAREQGTTNFLTGRNRHQSRGQSSSLHTDATVIGLPATPPLAAKDAEPCSEPRSDDSKYLNADLPCISTGLSESPNTRIRDWLSATCDGDPGVTANDVNKNHDVGVGREAPERRPPEALGMPTDDVLRSVSDNQSQRYAWDTYKRLDFDYLSV